MALLGDGVGDEFQGGSFLGGGACGVGCEGGNGVGVSGSGRGRHLVICCDGEKGWPCVEQEGVGGGGYHGACGEGIGG